MSTCPVTRATDPSADIVTNALVGPAALCQSPTAIPMPWLGFSSRRPHPAFSAVFRMVSFSQPSCCMSG